MELLDTRARIWPVFSWRHQLLTALTHLYCAVKHLWPPLVIPLYLSLSLRWLRSILLRIMELCSLVACCPLGAWWALIKGHATCLTKVLAACLVALTCSSSCTGDCTLVSVGVLSHWYGDLPLIIHFLIAYTGYCNMVRFSSVPLDARLSTGFRLLDLCHSAFVAISLWDSIIVTYGDMAKLDNIPWYVHFCCLLSARNLMYQ